LTGDSGYFASLNAFESLLVRNPRLVSPGNPEESELVMLLEGRRDGNSMGQMPLGGDPFAVLSDRGETDVTIEEIRDWITNLEAPAASTATSPQVATVQRIGAAHIELGLRELLGLTLENFYDVGLEHELPVLVLRTYDSYSVHHIDRLPMEWASVTTSNFGTLGGGSGLYTQNESRSVSTGFVQTLVPMSQAWCEMAIDKPGNTALFDVATSNTSTGDMTVLREQLADWHLAFLAEVPSDADIDLVVDQVFAPIEASSNPRKAWIAACSYFIRHPLFVFY
jgi:hypothetical protein